MATVVPRHQTKFQKISNADKCLIPAFQAHATLGHKEWFTLPIQPSAPTNAFSSAPKTIYYDLETHDCKQIEHLIVRLKLTASGGDIQLVGAPYLFSEIKLHSNKGSGKRLFRCLPEMIIAWTMLTMNDEGQDLWARLMNYALPEIKSKNQKKYWYNETNYIRDGESRYIYIPLPLNFIQFSALDMSHVSSPLRFTFETSSDIVINGSVSNLSLDALDFIVSGHAEADFDEHARKSLSTKSCHAYNFLSADLLTVNDKTFTASTKTEIYLDNFTGKAPFLLICCKGSTTPQASDGTLFDFYEFGKNATITLENTSGRDLISQGNPITQEQMYTMVSDQLGRKPYQGMHILCFTEDLRKSQAGVINGFFQFSGQRHKLCITFDSAPTQEIHQVSLGTTASSGEYRYAFENLGLSDQDADYNDSTADLLSIVNAMPCLQDKGLSASSVDANINTASSQNITFSSRSGRISDELGKITMLGAPVKVNSTSITTYGDDGWTTGSNYEMNIYCYKFSRFKVSKDGSLDVEEL